ncbi:MAG: ribonucleotide reductase N-terminal alpha domain-containing protein, partial [Candidatus Poseidoniales archaeon]
MEYLGINIDLERDNDLTEQAFALLKDYYMLEHEESPQQAFARASVAYCEGDYAFAQRIYDYASKRWFMFASPVLSNAPEDGQSIKGLPISCFLTYVGDNLDSLISHNAEVAWLSVKGGGVGGHWSDVRPVSDKAPGVI